MEKVVAILLVVVVISNYYEGNELFYDSEIQLFENRGPFIDVLSRNCPGHEQHSG